VRCLSRRPEALRPRVGPGTEVVGGDVHDPASLAPALAGVDAAYYLVHSMGAGLPYEKADRDAAEAFGAAARAAGVGRIVYLGGLGHGELSPHLASRQEVGGILRASGVPTVELRASIVIGSGSASFEIVRALVERLPAMVTPRWVQTRAQPIAIDDVVAYLLAAREVELPASEVVEIGGADIVTYLELMREYARLRGLRRLMIPVPVLSPRLSSLWLTLVTPVYASIGRDLVESLRNETIVRDPEPARRYGVTPLSAGEAIVRALAHEDREAAETRWSDEVGAPRPGFGGTRLGRRFVDARGVRVPVPPAEAFAPIQRIGGETGWYYGNALWRIRGALDLLAGGVGLRRGRSDPFALAVGATLDFWRVEELEPDRALTLAAEMRVPGSARLRFEVEPDGPDGSIICQTAVFDPAGVAGRLYWYVLWPLHALVFRGMLRGIAAATKPAQSRH